MLVIGALAGYALVLALNARPAQVNLLCSRADAIGRSILVVSNCCSRAVLLHPLRIELREGDVWRTVRREPFSMSMEGRHSALSQIEGLEVLLPGESTEVVVLEEPVGLCRAALDYQEVPMFGSRRYWRNHLESVMQKVGLRTSAQRTYYMGGRHQIVTPLQLDAMNAPPQ
jgi:hypothetical protein